MESTASITTVQPRMLGVDGACRCSQVSCWDAAGDDVVWNLFTTVRAEFDRWASYGPLGGFIGSIVFDPQNPSTVYRDRVRVGIQERGWRSELARAESGIHAWWRLTDS